MCNCLFIVFGSLFFMNMFDFVSFDVGLVGLLEKEHKACMNYMNELGIKPIQALHDIKLHLQFER